MSLAQLVAAMRTSFEETLVALDPASLVHKALPPRPPKGARVLLIAAGKAAPKMAAGALERWADHSPSALVVTSDGTSAEGLAVRDNVTLLRAGHPFPDERSVVAAQAALARAATLGPRDLLLALLSGGASALLAAPTDGFSLENKRLLLTTLFASGAPITAINTVRRHLSRIKGGRLALAAAPARTLTLALSDVIRGELHDIGSGPTWFDPTSVDDAKHVLQRFAPQLADAVSPHLRESLGINADAPRLRGVIVAAPTDLASTFARLFAAKTKIVVDSVELDEGDAPTIAARRLEAAHALLPNHAAVWACEPTMRLPSEPGRGGRAGWTALAVLSKLPKDTAFMAFASDGVDGSSGNAGAIVTHDDAFVAGPARLAEALSRCDDGPLHQALGTALRGQPTGHNLTDLHVVARCA